MRRLLRRSLPERGRDFLSIPLGLSRPDPVRARRLADLLDGELQ